MSFDDQDPQNFIRKVQAYKDVLSNTGSYRKLWAGGLRQEIINLLEKITQEAGLACTIEHRSELTNLEAIVLSLGSSKSGLGEQIHENLRRDLIKHNGSLVYQQLFNGKILVLINYPYIENYGQPQPPKTVAIYRPEELKAPYCMRHLESFITEIIKWEDYDDDQPVDNNQRIGFKFNFENEENGG